VRIIDRLIQYLEHKRITAYSFERTCQVANGYLKKQQKGKGSIGSDILERIHRNYFDINIAWLVTGEGDMTLSEASDRVTERLMMQEERQSYIKKEMIQLLQEQIKLLESALADKEKIIAMLESGKEKKKSKG
jgi:transcriptional regulator with XRE-family HTH domain